MNPAPEQAVLISPLGHAPGAVSGVYFALRAQGVPIRRVVVVSTADPKVQKAAEYVRAALPKGVAWRAILLPAAEYRDGKKVTMIYQRLFAWQVRLAHSEGYAVHIAVTGGRSGMGATAAMVAQFFGAQGLWHLWVSEEIEQNGQVDDLRPLGTFDPAADRYLNPTVAGEDAYALVAVPFVDLRTWGPQQRQQVMDLTRRMSTLLEQKAWETIQGLAKTWDTLSEEQQRETAKELENMLVAAGLLAPKNHLARALLLAQHAAELEALTGPEDVVGLMRQAWNWMQEHPAESISAGALFLQGLELALKALKVIG